LNSIIINIINKRLYTTSVSFCICASLNLLSVYVEFFSKLHSSTLPSRQHMSRTSSSAVHSDFTPQMNHMGTALSYHT